MSNGTVTQIIGNSEATIFGVKAFWKFICRRDDIHINSSFAFLWFNIFWCFGAWAPFVVGVVSYTCCQPSGFHIYGFNGGLYEYGSWHWRIFKLSFTDILILSIVSSNAVNPSKA